MIFALRDLADSLKEQNGRLVVEGIGEDAIPDVVSVFERVR